MKYLLIIFVAFLSINSSLIGSFFESSKTQELSKLNLTGFSSIDVKGSGKLHLVQGDSEEVEIRGENVEAKVEDDVLVLAPKNREEPGNPYIFVKVKSLESLRVGGSVSVDNDDEMHINELVVYASDQANVVIAVKGKYFSVTVGDQASVLASGIVSEEHITARDQGRYEAASLLADKVAVTAKGSANVLVNVRDTLTINVSDNATVRYGGEPEVKKTVQGKGRVTPLE